MYAKKLKDILDVQTCAVQTCAVQTCTVQTCAVQTCAMQTCTVQTCAMYGTSNWPKICFIQFAARKKELILGGKKLVN